LRDSVASKIGGLVALTGILGVILLIADKILWESLSGSHAYVLILFVLVDFVVAGFVLLKAGKTALNVAGLWSILRIVAQLGNVLSAPQMGLTYAQFADYLFDPLVLQEGNPPGVPAVLLDLIIVFELVVILAWFRTRSSAKRI
jgi:hypothetical protein